MLVQVRCFQLQKWTLAGLSRKGICWKKISEHQWESWGIRIRLAGHQDHGSVGKAWHGAGAISVLTVRPLGTQELPLPLGCSLSWPCILTLWSPGYLICSSLVTYWISAAKRSREIVNNCQNCIVFWIRRRALPPEDSHSRLLHSKKTQMWGSHKMMYVSDKC